jgi:Uncharacterized protein conserved in bacteria (DUF2252)
VQAATDIFLGWQRIKGLDGLTRDYYVRQFHDWKGGADVERLPMPGAAQYARSATEGASRRASLSSTKPPPRAPEAARGWFPGYHR